MSSDTSSNVLDLRELQRYVDGNDDLHDALGAPRGAHLPLAPFAQGEYNASYELKVPATPEERPAESMGGAGRAAGGGAMRAGLGAGAAGGRHLLRVNLGSQMHLPDQIGYEAAALRLLEGSGRTPRVLYVDGSRSAVPHGVLVEELLPGRPLVYESDLPRAARILADVHAQPAPADAPLVTPAHPLAAVVDECADMFGVYRSWPHADSAVLARVDQLFESAQAIARTDRARPAPTERRIVNTELNSSNFLMNDDGTTPGKTGGGVPAATRATDYLIDWEKPVLGEVEQDLAHFLAPTTTFWKTDTILTRAEMGAFLAAYEEAVAGRFALTGMRERFEEYLVVTCLRGITWCAMALTEYLGANRAATNADTLVKIRAYLEPGFLDFIAREYYGL